MKINVTFVTLSPNAVKCRINTKIMNFQTMVTFW